MGRNWGLRYEDITIHHPIAGTEKYKVSVFIRRSKTSDTGVERFRYQFNPAARNCSLCPVRAVAELVEVWDQVGIKPGPKDAAFTDGQGRLITRKDVMEVLVKAFGRTDKKAKAGIHSLRSGGAVALWSGGASAEQIMREGRWKSSAFRRYLWDQSRDIQKASEAMEGAEVILTQELCREDGKARKFR